jgi:hypothetical protein
MGLKERIENNIVAVSIGIALAAGSVSAGTVGWFASQRETLQQQVFQSKIDNIETRISSVERRIGGDKYLDIRTLFNQSNSPQTSPSSIITKYFASGNFSAATSLGDLAYEQSSEGQIMADMSGEPITDEFTSLLATLPADVWRGHSEYIEGSNQVKYLFPAVIVEHLTIDQLKKVYGEAFKFSSESDVSKELDKTKTESDQSNKENSDQNDFDEYIDANFRADLATPILDGILNLVTGINASSKEIDMSAVVKNIQKVGPLLYVQLLFEIDNVIVDKHHYDKYFMIKEIFLISRSESVTMLSTLIPTDNPLGPSKWSSEITEWLTYFHMAEL